MKKVEIMETKNSNIEELLKVHNIKKIEKIDEFKKYFDLSNLDEDNTPALVTDHKTVVIFDNSNFNETYLIDIINSYLDEHPSIANNVEFLYCDNLATRLKLFAPEANFEDNEDPDCENPLFLLDVTAIEKTYLSPGIFTLNPLVNEFRAHMESFIPLDLLSITKIFQASKIEE